jgi:hypothetical protein
MVRLRAGRALAPEPAISTKKSIGFTALLKIAAGIARFRKTQGVERSFCSILK